MDATARIKNLSFALEALSRIGGSWSHIELYDNVTKLLQIEINAAQKENEEPISPARPAKPTFDPNEEIPF